MYDVYLIFRSITHGQTGRAVLRRAGIPSALRLAYSRTGAMRPTRAVVSAVSPASVSSTSRHSPWGAATPRGFPGTAAPMR